MNYTAKKAELEINQTLTEVLGMLKPINLVILVPRWGKTTAAALLTATLHIFRRVLETALGQINTIPV